MNLTEIHYDNSRPIDGYGPGFFRVGGEVHQGPVLVTADSVRAWGGMEDHATLEWIAGHADVLFVGTGENIGSIPGPLRAALEDKGVGVEPMATPAACRTFNVLLAEGRRVAAALIPV